MAENIDLPQLQRQLEVLLSMVRDPHPGLFTWKSHFYEVGLSIARNFTDFEPTAGPDLLEALRDARGWFQLDGSNIRRKIDAAIAKAEGR